MKLVIDIDEEMYKQVIASDIIYVLDDNIDLIMVENAIANGTPLQAELEEIKAEIDNCLIHNPDYDECNVNMGLGISYEIIKKHISELKGENNG